MSIHDLEISAPWRFFRGSGVYVACDIVVENKDILFPLGIFDGKYPVWAR